MNTPLSQKDSFCLHPNLPFFSRDSRLELGDFGGSCCRKIFPHRLRRERIPKCGNTQTELTQLILNTFGAAFPWKHCLAGVFEENWQTIAFGAQVFGFTFQIRNQNKFTSRRFCFSDRALTFLRKNQRQA